MINTTHYNLQKAEANDIVNSLLPANTNMDKIDIAMFDNLNSGVHNASHTKTGTVHALVRTVTTANFFKFSATDDFRTGDTFTLDGEVITARTQAYAGLPDYAFRTGSEVIAITDHGVLTIYCGGDEITVDNALSPTSENPVQNKVIDGALSAIEDDVTAVANKVGSAPLQTDAKNCSGAINELSTHLTQKENKWTLIGSGASVTVTGYTELNITWTHIGTPNVGYVFNILNNSNTRGHDLFQGCNSGAGTNYVTIRLSADGTTLTAVAFALNGTLVTNDTVFTVYGR